MKILHVAWLDNNKSNGVSVVVPKHIKYQSSITDVSLLNCSNVILDLPKSDISYPIFTLEDCPNGNITQLKAPFNKPDIVVFHGIYFYYYYKVMKHLIKNNIPYVIIPHGSLTSFAQKKKRIKKYIGNYIFFGKLIKNATSIQYLTNEELIMSSYWRKASFVSGNGMDIPINKPEKYSDRESFNLTFIGRLDPYHKGLDVLVEACNLISNKMREKKIFLSISGPDDHGGKKKVTQLIEKYKLEDVVSLNDSVYGEEKKLKLYNSDVFVLTSRFEGQPLAVIEALSMGLPVLLTPGTNIADEVVENKCGWKSDFSAKDISETILEIFLQRDQLPVYSSNAYTYAKMQFSWDIIAKNAVDRYRKIIL